MQLIFGLASRGDPPVRPWRAERLVDFGAVRDHSIAKSHMRMCEPLVKQFALESQEQALCMVHAHYGGYGMERRFPHVRTVTDLCVR
jgi:hypothetical protein